MGGRRSYKVSDTYGKTKKLKKDKKSVREAIKDRDSREIARSSSKLVSDSQKTLDLVSEALGLLKFVMEYASKGPIETYGERRKRAREEWKRRKQERNLETSPAEDKFVIESVTRAMKRRRRK